ncbi:hypothetical protein AGMMS49936_11750 [Endomicrobiia bacterium]|nr:hypothetical protein AGMMS49936_11750 [Endomicrobiia bacterium]
MEGAGAIDGLNGPLGELDELGKNNFAKLSRLTRSAGAPIIFAIETAEAYRTVPLGDVTFVPKKNE